MERFPFTWFLALDMLPEILVFANWREKRRQDAGATNELKRERIRD